MSNMGRQAGRQRNKDANQTPLPAHRPAHRQTDTKRRRGDAHTQINKAAVPGYTVYN
jgi:hypothetical protein